MRVRGLLFSGVIPSKVRPISFKVIRFKFVTAKCPNLDRAGRQVTELTFVGRMLAREMLFQWSNAVFIGPYPHPPSTLDPTAQTKRLLVIPCTALAIIAPLLQPDYDFHQKFHIRPNFTVSRSNTCRDVFNSNQICISNEIFIYLVYMPTF